MDSPQNLALSLDSETVTVAVVNWNCRPDTLRVAAVVRSLGLNCVVVDNGSDMVGEGDELVRALGESRVVLLPQNLGYAAGVNAAARWALRNGYESMIVLNPDTEPTAEVLGSLIARREDAAVVGVQQHTLDERGGVVSYVTAAVLKGAKPRLVAASERADGWRFVDVVSGAALMMDLSFWLVVGGFDERYFHYKEEFDYCYRVGVAGGAVAYVDSSSMYHRVGGSLPAKSDLALYYHARNEVLFVIRRFGLLQLLRMPGLLRLITEASSISSSRAVLLGWFDGLQGRDGSSTHRRLSRS